MQCLPASHLHVAVVWAAGAFGYHPVDILRWVFDVTGFAVNAVLRIDLKAFVATRLLDHFINPSRAVALCRLIKQRQVRTDGYRWVAQLQVAGLIFLMEGVG